MPKIVVFLIILFLAVVIYLYYPFKLKTKAVTVKGQKFTVEIATTPNQLSAGLSNRRELCRNCGMLFVFPFPQVLSFWMKDTLIPLDMIFIDQDRKVVNFVTASINDLSLYHSISPALYCLELNAGVATDLGLQIGDTIDL